MLLANSLHLDLLLYVSGLLPVTPDAYRHLWLEPLVNRVLVRLRGNTEPPIVSQREVYGNDT